MSACKAVGLWPGRTLLPYARRPRQAPGVCPLRRLRCTSALNVADSQRGPVAWSTDGRPATDAGAGGMESVGL